MKISYITLISSKFECFGVQCGYTSKGEASMEYSKENGDFGRTDLAEKRIGKESLLIEALGQLDMCIAETICFAAKYPFFKGNCQKIVENCSLFCSVLTGYKKEKDLILPLQWIETEIQKMPPPLDFNFIYPYDNPYAADINHLRCVARNAERSLWRCHEEEPISQEILSYMNRLSKYWYCICCKELERMETHDEVQ